MRRVGAFLIQHRHESKNQVCPCLRLAHGDFKSGMLLAAKDDNKKLNCLEAPPKPRGEEEAGEEAAEGSVEEEVKEPAIPADNVFNMDAWDKVKPPKQPKPSRTPRTPKTGRTPSPIWTKIGSVFDNLSKGLDDIYERIEE